MELLNCFIRKACMTLLITAPFWGANGNENNNPNALKEKVTNQDRQFFVKNKGQVTYTNGTPAEGVKYTLSSGNVKVYFQEDRVSYTYPKREYQPTPKRPDTDSALQTTALYRMDMVLQEANEDVNLRAEGEKASHSNHLTNPENPVEKVPHFGKLVYEEVYEGIDLVFKFDDGRLKYEFVVHEEGDPSAIAMAYEGAESVEKAESGGLAISNPFGQLQEAEPVAFQQGSPDAEIPCEFVLKEDREISFELEDEPEKPFVIDPYLSYSTFLGGSSIDEANDIAINNEGGDQIYVAGNTESSSLPNATGQISYTANKDGFLAEFSADGSTLNWFTYYGNQQNDRITGVDVYHASGSFRFPYVTGYSSSEDLPGTPGSAADGGTNPSFGNGFSSIFTAKFDKFGAIQKYVFIGSDNHLEQSGNIVANGQVYITGTTFATFGGFNTTSNAAFPAQGGATDGIFAKFGFDLNNFHFSTYYGGAGSSDPDPTEDFLRDIEEMPNGDLVMQGLTDSYGPNRLAGVNGYLTSHQGEKDVFLARFTPSGSFVSSTYLGGANDDENEGYNGLEVDDNGFIHVTGYTASGNFPTSSGAYQGTKASDDDMFYARFSDLSTLDYATFIGGNNSDLGTSLIASGEKEYIVGGSTSSDDMPELDGTQNGRKGSTNRQYSYMIKFKNDALEWATYHGGSPTGSEDGGLHGLANREGDNMFFATGYTESSDFPVTSNAHQSNYQGGSDAYLSGFMDTTCISGDYTTLQNATIGPNSQLSSPLQGKYKVYGYLKVEQGASVSINGSKIVFDECAELSVPPNSQLAIDNSQLSSCGNFWEGIRVRSSGSEVTISQSVIKNAEVGIDAEDPQIFDVTETFFVNNKYHLTLRGYDNTNTSAVINKNYFRDLKLAATSCSSIPLAFKRSNVNKMVYIGPSNDVSTSRNIDVKYNQFRGTDTGDYLPLHIHGANNVTIEHDTFETSTRLSNAFVKNSQNIDFVGMPNHNDIWLEKDQTGVKVLNSQAIVVNNYAMTVRDSRPPVAQAGIHFKEVEGTSSQNSEIKNCGIFRCQNGIEYYNTKDNAPLTAIKDNTVSSNRYSIVVAQEQHPENNNTNANPQTNLINLDITCNRLMDNEIGILGCGRIDPIGNSTTGAGNYFGSSGNTNWDILWQNPTPAIWQGGSGGTNNGDIDYNYGAYQPNSDPNLNTNNVLYINGEDHPFGFPNLSANNDVSVTSASTPSCYGNFKKDPTTSVKPPSNKGHGLKTYPNPFDHQLKVELTSEVKKGRIKVTSMVGKKVAEQTFSGQAYTLNTETWSTGPYIIHVYGQDGKVYKQKVVKVKP